MGINPFSSSNLVKSNAAIYAGFQSGRSEYERMNGYLSAGILTRIVTDSRRFSTAGMLGMPIY
jgi:hypothetical protein